MLENKIYVDTVGLIIEIDMGEDLTGATGLAFEVKKPDDSLDSWTPSIYDSNYLRYTTQNGDLDKPGIYKIQPKFTLSGWTGPCNTVVILVYGEYQ